MLYQLSYTPPPSRRSGDIAAVPGRRKRRSPGRIALVERGAARQSCRMKRAAILLILPPLLGGCLARTAIDVVTLPVRAVGQGVDWATTSQDEADRNRGRELRRQEERDAKERRRAEREERRRARDDADEPR